jgi:hypothetical protein
VGHPDVAFGDKAPDQEVRQAQGDSKFAGETPLGHTLPRRYRLKDSLVVFVVGRLRIHFVPLTYS